MAETLLVRLEPQPTFPHEDLTDSNAEILELWLSNKLMVQQLHEGSEVAIPMYRTSHPVLRAASVRSIHPLDIPALEHGLQLLEAIAGAVNARHDEINETVLAVNAFTLTVTNQNAEVKDYFLGAHQRFKEDLPLTTEVVVASSSRFFGASIDSTILGAAIARQFELDNVGPLELRPEAE